MRALPDAHRRFVDRGVPLLCMADHPIATDPAAADLLLGVLADGRSALGAQLHAWVTPPYVQGRWVGESYQGNLPEAIEAAKIDRLTDTIAQAFGRRPRAFRAGRYGVGPNTRRLLAERGYLLDSSVRARYDYRADGGPDFRAVGNDAYRADGLVELPLTTLFTGLAKRGGARLYDALGRARKGRAAASRLGMLSRVALTPEDMPVADALRAVNAAVEDGVRLLVFAFHSPTLVPGNTPYVRDAADLRRFWGWWDAVLARLERLGVEAASLDEVLAAAG